MRTCPLLRFVLLGLLVVLASSFAYAISTIQVTEVNATPQTPNQTFEVNISANVTSDNVIEAVFAQIVRSNGSAFNLTMTNDTDYFNVTYTFTQGDPAGGWNITIIANNSAVGVMNDSEKTNITVLDIFTPYVVNANASDAVISQGSSVNVTVNVSDETLVDTVLLQIARGNGSVFNVTMDHVGNFYNFSINVADFDPPRFWWARIIANDSTGNVNNTYSVNFTVNDLGAPNVTSPNATPEVMNQGLVTNVSVNVTDNYQVDKVIAQVTRSNGSAYNVTMTANGIIYNASINVTTSEPAGQYNVTFLANASQNDTAGNWNSSIRYNFSVTDITNPLVYDGNASVSSLYQGGSLNVTVNVTDETLLDTVLAQVVSADATIATNYSMNNVVKNLFNATIPIGSGQVLGLYNVTFLVNDSAGNKNSTISVNFTVLDNANPNVTAVNVSSESINQGIAFNITANVSDNSQLSAVLLQITRSNGSAYNATMNVVTGPVWNATVVVSTSEPAGIYNFTILSNDTSGNKNYSVSGNFTINDITNPRVYDSNVSNGLVSQGTSLNVTVNVTEETLLDIVLAQVVSPDATVATNYTMNNVVKNLFNATVTLGAGVPIGLWNVTFIVNDSTGNVNRTTVDNFTVQDVANPSVFADNISVDVRNQGQSFNLTANVTDNTAVNIVLAQITRSNGSAYNTTMNLISGSGQVYNVTLTASASEPAGVYNYTILANDTSGNRNTTTFGNFTIVDVTNPRVIAENASTGSINQGQSLNVTVNATDETGLDLVVAQITRANGSAYNVTMNLIGGLVFNTTIATTVNDPAGVWNVKILANDTKNNLNNSQKVNFTVNDITRPKVTAENASTGSLNQGQSLNITANATDETALSVVLAQVTRANGSAYNTTMNLISGLVFNTTLTISVDEPAGVWNVTILANDTTNNLNNSRTVNFTVNDITRPKVTAENASTGSLNQGQSLNITANATDETALSVVWAEIVRANGSAYNTTMNLISGLVFNTTLTISVDEPAGVWNVTILANDTTNNLNNSRTVNFTVNDITRPKVTAENASTGSLNQGQSLNITANATDETALSVVWAEIVRANGSAYNFSMNNIGGLVYNMTLTTSPSDSPGLWMVTLVANDTTNNLNNSRKVNFTVNDIVRPNVTYVNVTPLAINQSYLVNISANVSDNYRVDTVLAQITRSNGTAFNVSMNLVSGITYNTSWQTTPNDPPGTWNITILSNDTSSNQNNTIATSFNVFDVAVPNVTGLNVTPTTINQSDAFNVTINVTDNFRVDTVLAQVVRANGSAFNLTMTVIPFNISFNTTYTTSINDPHSVWNITIIANDTSGNTNRSVSGNFTLNDVTKPLVTAQNVTPLAINQSSIFNLSVNVSDNYRVDTVLAQVVRANGTAFNLTMNFVSGITYNVSYTTLITDPPGAWNITFLANDTAGNQNYSVNTNITVFDITRPTVSYLNVTPIAVNQSFIVNISANVSDNYRVDTVIAKITRANGSEFNLTMNLVSGITYNTSQQVSLNDPPGKWNITILVNDTSDNKNHTVSTNFNVSDITNPSVISLSVDMPIANQTDSYNLSATVTDNYRLDTILVNVTNMSGVVVTTLTGTLSNTNVYSVVYGTGLTTSPGNYTYTFYANDTSNNKNNTMNSTFVVNDVTRPNVTSPMASPLIGNQTNSFNLTATVLDNFLLDTVRINVTNMSGIVVGTLTSTLSAPGQYSAVFTTALNESPGNYTYRIVANDSSGNANVTITSSFIVNDVTNPNVTSPMANPLIGNQSNAYNLTVTVFDNFLVNVVTINVTNMTGVVVGNLSTTVSAPGQYSAIFPTAFNQSPGNYTYRIVANDSVGNANVTITSSFIVNDVTNPVVLGLNASPAVGNQSTPINMTFNVSDNFLLDTVRVNMTYPNGTITTLTTTVNLPGRMSAVFTPTVFSPAGNYTYRVIANDSSGNANVTMTSTFVIRDFFNMTVTQTLLTEDPVNTTRNVTYAFIIKNTGTINLSNISFDAGWNQIYFNWTNSSTTIDVWSFANGSVKINELLDAGHFSAPLLFNQTVYFNVTWKALKNITLSNISANFTVLDSRPNTTYWNTTGGVQIIAQNASVAGYPNGTNWNAVPDMTNVSNATIGNGNGSINWFDNIDAAGQNFDLGTVIGDNYIIVNTSLYNPSINTSARITMYNVTCGNPQRISYVPNYTTGMTLFNIMGSGADCVWAGICSNVSCSAGVLTFTANHFTGFAAGATSNLTIGATGNVGHGVANITAMFVNSTNGALITGASCNISINGVNYTLLNDSTGYHYTSYGDLDVGSYPYDVTCAKPTFTTLFTTDTLVMSAGASGGGGSRLGGYFAYNNVNVPASQFPSVATPAMPVEEPTQKMSAFDLIDIIKAFYKGTKQYTAFQIIDFIKSFYEVK